MSQLLDARTPLLQIVDSRGLIVRVQAFHRSTQATTPAPRVTCQAFDLAGRLVSSRDPRLSAPNQKTVYTLPGQTLCSESVDAGWRLALLGEAGQPVEGWDSRGSVRQISYDALLRPLAITEQARVVECFMFGGPNLAEHNQCNRLIRHDDTAGTRLLEPYGFFEAPLVETRHFTREQAAPDWPESLAERDALLGAQGLQSRWGVNALGETITQTDAEGNIRHWGWTVAGQPKVQSLNLVASAQPQILVDKISYNALNQVEQETAGNGVISQYTYDPKDGRLLELRAALAGRTPLQHFKYTYDPIGNILQIEDAAQLISCFAGQCIKPVSTYRYDTLYQLIEATGREVKTGSSQGPTLPGLQNLPPDPTQMANYTQSYDYDAAGNLLQMRHVGAQIFTRTMRVAPDSNRSLPEGDVDMDFAEAFDANGNLLQLVRGQALRWNARNQLQQLTTVVRAEDPNDSETYIYNGQGQRCRKITSTQARNRTLVDEVRYLPGLEIRTRADGEILHVITAQAGRNSIRVLHWQAGKPDDIANDQVRYSLSDHLGSSTLELDQQGGLISQESYYPFGGTSWWAARSAVEAKYKTVRYSGKERDASGLYYYGFRYYAPWLYRWISPDPAGDVDGLDLYRFSRNCPVVLVDQWGSSPFRFDEVLKELNQSHDPVQAVGLANITRDNPYFGGTLAVALSSSRKGLAFARQKINQALSPFGSNSDRQILMRYFKDGPEVSHYEDTQILKMLGARIGKLSSFLQGWDSERIVGVGGDRNSPQVAWQYTNDAEHHLFMRESVAHESAHVAAWNIIHETSHMILGTQDYWYMNTPGATPRGATGLASYGGKIDALARLQRLELRHENIIWDGPDAASLDQAAFIDPLARAQTLLNNADSISLATAYINQRFNGPMASLSMLNKTASSIPALELASTQAKPFIKQRRLSL
jgi:insecticidal toxin complex protein TccC